MAGKKTEKERAQERTVPKRGQSPAAAPGGSTNDETEGLSLSSEGAQIQAGKNRKVQVARTGSRKLFDEAAQSEFLEWFAATCNLAWSAEMAGFNYKTVLRHRMNDGRFREGYDRALEQAYARLEAKRLETKRKEVRIGIEGDWDAPEMDEMAPERVDAILRDRARLAAGGAPARKQGRRPVIASNAEVREALEKRLKAFGIRVSSEADPSPREEAPPPRCTRSLSPGNPGEDLQ
jgi:hypothetical protein